MLFYLNHVSNSHFISNILVHNFPANTNGTCLNKETMIISGIITRNNIAMEDLFIYLFVRSTT